jgi:hypothetical protein
MGRGGRATRLLAALVLGGALTGCWPQMDAGPEHRRHNPYEQGITPANVATLTEQWAVTGPGTISEPVLGSGRVHYLRRTGGAPSSAVVETLDATAGDLAWSHELLPPGGGDLMWTNGLNSSGGELWTSHTASASASLVRLDPATGATIAEETGIVVLSPSVTGDGVVVDLRMTSDLRHQVMVVRDRATLAVRWSADVFATRPSPTILVGDGLLHLVDGSSIRAYALDGCGEPTCPPLWVSNDGRSISAAALAPDGGLVTVGSTFSGPQGPTPPYSVVVVRDPATGSVRWNATIEVGAGGLAVDDHHIYTGDGEGRDPNGVPIGANALLAFDAGGCGAAHCTPVWTAPLPGEPGDPLVGGGVVYTSVGDDLHALGTDGTSLAVVPGAGNPRSLGEGRLYTTTTDAAAGTTTLRALAPG